MKLTVFVKVWPRQHRDEQAYSVEVIRVLTDPTLAQIEQVMAPFADDVTWFDLELLPRAASRDGSWGMVE